MWEQQRLTDGDESDGGRGFLYYNGDGAWLIGDREDMEAGRDRAWLGCLSDALAPSALAEGWMMVPGEAKGMCTEPAPEARVRTA